MTREELHDKYPEILGNVCLEHDEGWNWLIDKLCSQLQWDTDHNKYPQVVATQVKEKYGGLRFYVGGANESQWGAIQFAEYISSYICEKCGSTTQVTQTKGWITTLCATCMEEHEKTNKETD